MAPLTLWVEGDGNVLGARCCRTSDYCVSLVTVHVGPTWVSFEGSLHQDGEGLRSPASRSTVGWKPGHDSPWTLSRDLQPSMERATGHQRAGRWSDASLDTTRPGTRSQKRLRKDRTRSTHKDGRREVSVRLPIFLWLPFLVGIPSVQVTAAYSRHTQAYVGRTRVVRRPTGRVRSTRFRLARFLRGSFLCGFCRGFRSCRRAGEVVLFAGQRRRKASCCLVSSGLH